MIAFVCALGSSSAVRADDAPSFVLRVGRILPVSPDQPWEIKSGVIIVRDGRIAQVGRDIALPPDLPVFDFPDATAMPGLVAAATSMIPPHTGDESIRADTHAVDAFDAYADYSMALANGVTTVHLTSGEHRLVSGVGAVVKLGGPIDERILRDRADLTLTFGTSAYHPPKDVTYVTPSSSDVAIPTPIRQRPDSRLGQFYAIEEALGKAAPVEFADRHFIAFLRAWRDENPLRIQVRRGADIEGAVKMLRRHKRKGYLVGAAEADLAVDAIRDAGVPVVYRMADPLRGGARDIGNDPDALEADMHALSSLQGVTLALAGPAHQPVSDLRLAAATARRAGLTRRRVIEAITRVPAEILGVADRVGSLSPERDADIVLFSEDPLRATAHVLRAYIGGRVAFDAPATGALVVRAGTIWIDEHRRIHDGAILIEKGRITAVDSTVPHPPFARVIDAGRAAFVTPGFIDALGHLGLEGDHGAAPPDVSLASLIGIPDRSETRVARAGVTTIMMTSYEAASNGSRVLAVKTAGQTRADRVVRETAGLYLDLRKRDPLNVAERLKKRLEAGKKYHDKWKKYEKDLAEWKEKKAKGEKIENGKKKEEVTEEAAEADPITGTWSVTVSGGPIPEPQTGTMRLKLTGQDIEGYISIGGDAEEVRVVATLDDKHISGRIEIDIGTGEYPQIEADITEEDHIEGTVSVQGFTFNLDAQRTDKAPVEFKVTRHKTRGKGGRPLPPKVDESLEPLRSVLEKRIPLLVAVRTPAQIDAALKAAAEYEVPLALLDAEEAALHAETLRKQKVGVILPQTIVRRRQDRPYLQADDLARKEIPVAFQSAGEDRARTLPLVGLYAVERGLSADLALAALTTNAARIYHLEDRIGSLQPGRDGDLVIFSGHPFDPSSRVLRVIVNGKQVPR